MKKYFVGIFALLLIGGAYAFTTQTKSHKKETLKWFEFIDIPNNDPENPNHYQPTSGGGTTEPSCTTGEKMCAVYAEPASGNPDIPNLDEVDQIREKP
jgi:hypothetical protein